MADFIKLVEVVDLGDEPQVCDTKAPVVESSSSPEPSSPAEDGSSVKKKKAYKGPYPVKMLKKVRQELTDCLILKKDQCESNYMDRIIETLKLKLKVKSKFDGDKRLLRRIERDTAQFRDDIEDRINYLDRKLGKPREIKRYFTAASESPSPPPVRVEAPPPRAARVETTATLPKFTFFDEDDKKADDSAVETLPFFINKNKVNEVSKPLSDLKASKGKKTAPPPPSVDSKEKLDQLAAEYRKLRDQRNKGLRKKKGADVDLKRRAIGQELKSIRIEMKKLRRQCSKEAATKSVGDAKNSKKKTKKMKNNLR